MRIRRTAILEVKVHGRKIVKTCRYVKHTSNPILNKDKSESLKIFGLFLNYQDLLHLHIHIHFANSRKKPEKGSYRMENFF